MNELFLQLHLTVNLQHKLLQSEWILFQNYWKDLCNFNLSNVLNLIQQHLKVAWIHSVLHHQVFSSPLVEFKTLWLMILWETIKFYPSFVYLLLLLQKVILKWCYRLLLYRVYLNHRLDQLPKYSFFFSQKRTQFIYEQWILGYHTRFSFNLDLTFILHSLHLCIH